MAGSLAATKIITKGLNCGRACDGIITTYFSLYCKEPGPLPPKVGGGPYPRDAWNKIDDIQNFFKPVVDSDTLNPAIGYVVTFKAQINGREVEKHYSVSRIYGRVIVKMMRWSHRRKDDLNVFVNNIKTRLADVTVKVKNLRRKR